MQSYNIVFTGKNQLELRREAVPEIGEGQILVQTQRSLISTGTEGICFSRNFAPGTHWDNWVKYPFYPGYSTVGTVMQTAPDVQTLQPGDRVAVRTGHQQFFVTSASGALKVPNGVSDDAATWFALGSIVQNGVRRAALELGDTVVIIGLGLLGQLAIQYARLGGAGEIIAVDTAPIRLEMAKKHGATHILQMDAAAAKAEVSAITQGRLADVVFDVTGHPAVFQEALGLSRRFGKLLLLGDTGEPSRQCLTADVVTRGVRIFGAHDGDAPPHADDFHFWTHHNMMRLFFGYLQRGQMQVDDLITHRFTPQQAEQAYSTLMTDRMSAMGVVFDWSQLD